MTFSLPESSGIPRLVHIVFTDKGNPHIEQPQKYGSHPSILTTAKFVPHCQHSLFILIQQLEFEQVTASIERTLTTRVN